ncbi:hypothetical protein ACQ86N_45695 [Puia sp. P3]|uniref:hypothetical protein n=1 Tax=Puia sp. P3 TaxID=3423952 RepID=UPI003D668FC6
MLKDLLFERLPVLVVLTLCGGDVGPLKAEGIEVEINIGEIERAKGGVEVL